MEEDQKDHEKINNRIPFDTVVLSGGGLKGLLILGALQYCADKRFNKASTYIGTSIGSIIGYLISIGYSPVEIIVYIRTRNCMNKLKDYNLMDAWRGKGVISYGKIQEELEKMTIEKIGRLITLKELYENFKKTLICCTYNRTTNKVEYISHENYPEMPCLIATKLSSNLPYIFEDCKYMGCFYSDGGLSNNFPIDIAQKKGKRILGLNLFVDSGPYDPNASLTENIYKLLFIPVNQIVSKNIQEANENCVVVQLVCPNLKIFDIVSDFSSNLDMFSSGYNQIKEYFEKNIP